MFAGCERKGGAALFDSDGAHRLAIDLQIE
jgi:hypothetical protein